MIYIKNNVVKEEFQRLVAEMRNKKITSSMGISDYIIKNNVSERYPHLSAKFFGENINGSVSFKGIAPQYYKELCNELKVTRIYSSTYITSYYMQ